MQVNSSKRVSNSYSDNRKSRIENPKWVGLIALAFTFAFGGAVAESQQPAKVHRIGRVALGGTPENSRRIDAFRQGLRQLGYEEGKDIAIESRYADGKPDRLNELMAELIRLKVAVIVTLGPTPTRAAKAATATIPIVMTQDSDPVGNGFVASLARPGGNITGLSTLAPEISGKQLELLKETVPKLSRLAVAGSFDDSGPRTIVKRDWTCRWAVKCTAAIPGRTGAQGYRNCIPSRK
jgi:ABC-type uncharacterized transport system substrate-binding protein